MGTPVKVLLTTEGTYPVTQGGVSTWCDQLARHTSGVNYTVLTVMANPYLTPGRELPASVHSWIPVPLWGTRNPASPPGTQAVLRRIPSRAIIHDHLIPALSRLHSHIWNPGPATGRDAGADFVTLHRLFRSFDYQLLLKNRTVWQWYVASGTQSRGLPPDTRPTLEDLVQSLGWLYRFLAVLAIPIPPVDVAHASAAAFCALPCVVAKRYSGMPLLLTEHGVYLREQYNSVGRAPLSPFLKRWLLGLVQVVSRAAYDAADLVAPVAAFNTRWEQQLGVPASRTAVIYNGVDGAVYHPRPRPADGPPVVVSVARVDPVKDLATLMRSAAIAVRDMPGLRYVVYGGISVPGYYRHLLDLRAELGLADRFHFAGHTADVPGAYARGDVIALSSISEGFPYAVIEAMMCGRPVVATDVGGTAEALGDAGLLVPPRNPEALAAATLRLLRDKDGAALLGEQARTRALALFTIERFVTQYQEIYGQLALKSRE